MINFANIFSVLGGKPSVTSADVHSPAPTIEPVIPAQTIIEPSPAVKALNTLGMINIDQLRKQPKKQVGRMVSGPQITENPLPSFFTKL